MEGGENKVFYSQMLDTGGSFCLSDAQSAFTQSPRSDWLRDKSSSGSPLFPLVNAPT